MTGLTFIALWGIAVGATDGDNYAEAHQATIKSGRPMLVMVSTDWCAPCQVMKKTIIPQCRQRGVLARVAFAIVNPDRDRELAQQLTGGGPVPQLVMFRKTPQGWLRRKLVGGQSVEAVEEFINEGMAVDKAPDKGTAEKVQSGAEKKEVTHAEKRPTA